MRIHARAARTPEIAAEMYLASLIVIDQESYMDRAYLDELARQMSIAPASRPSWKARRKQGCSKLNGVRSTLKIEC